MSRESQPGILTWLVIVLVTCLVLLLFQKVLWLVVPGLLTLVLYYCLQPMLRGLVRAGLTHRTAARLLAAVMLLVTVVVVVLLMSVAASRAAAWQAMIAHYVQGGLDFLQNTQHWLTRNVPLLGKSSILKNPPTNLEAIGEQLSDKYLGVLIIQAVHWLPALLLTPYLTYFLLLDGIRFKKSIIRSVPNAFFEKTLLLFERIDKSLQNFFVGLMKVTCLDTVCLGLGLWLLGISFPFLLALVAAVLAWVPYLGSMVGCILVVLVAATDLPNDPATAYGCMLLFISVRILDDFVFLPLTIGRSLRLHPVLSVLMLFLGAAAAGPIGLLLVLPVMGVVAVVTETLGQMVMDKSLRARFQHSRLLQAKPLGATTHVS